MTMKDYVQIVGQMFLKTLDISENVYEAMKLRGFEGELYINNKVAGYVDYLYLIIWVVIFIFL